MTHKQELIDSIKLRIKNLSKFSNPIDPTISKEACKIICEEFKVSSAGVETKLRNHYKLLELAEHIARQNSCKNLEECGDYDIDTYGKTEAYRLDKALRIVERLK